MPVIDIFLREVFGRDFSAEDRSVRKDLAVEEEQERT